MIKETWNDSTGSYIRITGDEKERIADRILSAHVVDGILPLDIEIVNGHREYVYETSGYQNLGSVLDEKPLSKEKWISLLEQLVKTGSHLDEYLLDSEHLMLDMETVFLTGDKPQVSLIYISEHRKDLSEALSRLVEQAIKYPEYDRASAEFLYRLHALVTRGNLTRKSLLEFLREEGDGAEQPTEERKDAEVTDETRTKKNKRRHQRPTKEASQKETSQRETNPKKTSRKEAKQKKEYYLPVGILVAGLLIPSICLRCGCFQNAVSGSLDTKMVVIAYLFFLAVAGIGAYRLWPAGRPEVIWSEEDELTLCLLPGRSDSDGNLRVMPVTVFPWRIGNDERHVDGFIDSDGVAPVHARLERESRSIFLIDEESRTGTTLNGNRLTPWERQRVKDGDVIGLGSASYIVEISD